jgi:zinc protease
VTRTLLALALLPGVAGAATAGPLATREVLPNGLVLLVAERPAVPIVVVRVFHAAGAAFDPPTQAGLAHLTGTLLTRGAGNRTAQDIDAAIEFVGGSLEAGGGRDGITASLSVLKRDLGLGLELLADVVLRPAFPEAELKRKAAEIQAAIQRSEEHPETVAARALARLVFPGHRYGTPVEGTRDVVGRLTRDDVVSFWQGHVRPDTSIIVVVGAITLAEARREVVAHFGAWRRPSAPPPAPPSAPTETAPQVETISRELTQATILLGRTAVNQADPEYFPLAVASYVLGGGSTSRLYARVRDEGGLAYSVYSSLNPGKYGASVVVSAQTRNAEVERVLRILREELGRLSREPVAAAELELAKAYLIGSFPLRLDTSAKVADFLVAVEEMGLGLDYADRYRERIARVTAADVQRVAARYFVPESIHRVVVGKAP